MDQTGKAIDATAGTLGMIQSFGILALILAAMAALYFLVRRPDRLDAEALRHLADKRGWTIERRMAGVTAGTGETGRGYRIEIRPADGSEWSCEVTRYRNIEGGGHVRKTEFADEGFRLPAGMVVIGPAITGKEAEAAVMLLGNFDDGIGQMLLSTILGEETRTMGRLRLLKDAGISGATVFASSDAEAGRIGAAYAPLLASWLAAHRDERAFPILIAGPEKLRLRLRTDADDAEALETFLDHALTTRKALSGS